MENIIIVIINVFKLLSSLMIGIKSFYFIFMLVKICISLITILIQSYGDAAVYSSLLNFLMASLAAREILQKSIERIFFLCCYRLLEWFFESTSLRHQLKVWKTPTIRWRSFRVVETRVDALYVVEGRLQLLMICQYLCLRQANEFAAFAIFIGPRIDSWYI